MEAINMRLARMQVDDRRALEVVLPKVYEHRERAEFAFNAQEYTTAKAFEMLAAKALLGNACQVPLKATRTGGGAQWTTYTELHPLCRVLLIACYNSMAKCCLKKQEFPEALTWLEESRFVGWTTRFEAEVPLYDWMRYHIKNLDELAKQILVASELASEAYEKIGNTGMAYERLWNVGVESFMPPEMTDARDMEKMDQVSTLRHPDPSLTSNLRVEYPELQVLGSWKKLTVKKGGMKPRLAFASFIWHGKLYMGGGFGEPDGLLSRDLCVLDLAKLDTWKPLPSIPYSETSTGRWYCWNFAVHNDRAYLFGGNLLLHYFDLHTETWRTVMTYDLELATGLPPTDPMRHKVISHLQDSTQVVVGDHLYVFGGSNYKTKMGSNLFVVLDLKTFKWRHLSGELSPSHDADYSCPGPRRHASSWVDPAGSRIYLFGGVYDRTAGEPGDRYHAEHGYAFEDFWSWDIKEEGWRMERFAGSIPCPRAEAAYVYNPKLNKAFIFGGYNDSYNVRFEEHIFPYAYFADTFMFCPESDLTACNSSSPPRPASSRISIPTASASKWKHVLTRGFPTYRAQSQLHVDPDTGKMYLFGGFTNTDWMRAGKLKSSRTFGDLWELRVDVPGGGFEDGSVDLAEESRTAKVGPWQRCFACGSAGRWKKCGGSCKGRAFFCDSNCLVDGWKEHKEMHGCRKI